jgi:antitoxin component YwqK of YwqJK toxin-antitoxin module
MTLHKIIPALIIIFLSFGCSHNDELLIKNGNGGISERYIFSNDTNHNIKFISYYINGTIKEEGNIHSGERIGFWKQYYSDGIIRWQGEYRNGKREGSSIDTSVTDRTKIVFKGFTKDNKYAFRFVSTDSISPDDLMYGTNNAEVTKIKNFDSCDFLIKPLNNDTIHLQIYAVAKYGVFTIFDKKIDPSILKKWKN